MDSDGVLTTADAFDQSWGLDGLGNFSSFDDDGSSQTRTANAVNEITTITGGWVTPAYDDAGDMISGPKPGDESTRIHYVYDAWNRLVEVRTDDSGEPGALLAEYQYDGLNRRIDKVVTGGSHAHYFYNQDWQLVEDRFVDGQGATVASNQYVWSPRYIDALIVRFQDGNGDGDLLDAEDNVRYYTGDANYNVTATIDAGSGDLAGRYAYNAYGKATVYSPTWTSPAAPAEDGPLYCGYFFDVEVGLYHLRNRYYHSGLSAFISRDPVESGLNLYRYCGDSPLDTMHPTGQIDCVPKLQGHVGDLTNEFHRRFVRKMLITFAIRSEVTDNHLTYTAESTVKGPLFGVKDGSLLAQSILDVDITCKCEKTVNKSGELVSLRWTDLNFENARLTLTDETGRPAAEGRKRRELKSRRSRSFPIHPDLLRVLQGMPHVDAYVFHGPRGGRLKPDTVRRILVREVIEPLTERFPAPTTRRGSETADFTASGTSSARPAPIAASPKGW